MTRSRAIWISATASVLAAAAWQVDTASAAQSAEVVVRAATNVGFEEVHSVVVRFGDLELDRPSGIATLYKRLNLAADNVCGAEQLTGQTYVSPFWRNCVRAAVTQAVEFVDRPDLTAYHDQHS